MDYNARATQLQALSRLDLKRAAKILKLKGVSLPTFFREDSTVHSRKPQIFYQMLCRSTPEPRIDVFARKRHYGFDAWGDQVENVPTIENWQ